ncbi:hypothetical protein [Micromonospora qiuiae]|nr:hypothetical protein [Micromonospora qiuiae]
MSARRHAARFAAVCVLLGGVVLLGGAPAVALAADGSGGLAQTANESSGGSPVMYFGIAMVAAGALLIGLLIHRSRKDRRQRHELPEVPLPRNPGGTTYRSAQGAGTPPVPPGQGVVPPVPRGPGTVPPMPPGQVYGSGRPATPRVYGGPPQPRQSGNVYGARPADPGDQTRAMPPDPPAAGSAVPPERPAPPAVGGAEEGSGPIRDIPG